jgi:hypothetical protein
VAEEIGADMVKPTLPTIEGFAKRETLSEPTH